MNLKKAVSIVLAAAFVMVPAFTAMADDAKPNLNAPKASDITIDGALDEWNLEEKAVLKEEEQLIRDPGQREDENDFSLDFYVMWDEENIYLAATILDDTPFMYREGFPPDMADTLVLLICTDPNADPERTEYVAEDFRVSMVIDDYYWNTGIDRDMIEDDKGFETIGEDGDEQVLEGYEAAVQEIEGGYTLEIKIPWENFSNENIPALVPEAGMVVSFDVGMFDLDFPCPGVATARIEWAGPSQDVDEDPSLWGTLTFIE